MWSSKMDLPTFKKIVIFLIDLIIIQSVFSERIIVPCDVHPGYIIKTYPSRTFSLLENKYSNYFTILNDNLITTHNITHLADTVISFSIIEEPSNKEYKQIELFVKRRERILEFSKDIYYGTVKENQPLGTIVQDLESLSAKNQNSSNVKYQFLSGNKNSAFSIYYDVNSDAVEIHTNDILDHEVQPQYNLILQANSSDGDSATTVLKITVGDENDNSPVPEYKNYFFRVPSDLKLYSIIGTVKALDADGDHPVFHLLKRHPIFAVVPKSGQIILTSKPDIQSYQLSLRAHDQRQPFHYSEVFSVFVEVFDKNASSESVKQINTIRKKRSILPTRTYEFKESDGIPGKVMFNLDRSHIEETFRLDGENRWIEVGQNGEVRAKEPWDFEQLEKEKNIDFMVNVYSPLSPEIHQQRVIINIKDVNDEEPYFINRPMPMQAVVQLNAPPGTSVFKLQARDPDTDSAIHYFLVRDRTGNRFEVDERSGEVRTVIGEPYMLDKEYVLYVKAEDHGGPLVNGQFQSTGEKRLSIIGGRRPPQFYMERYSTTIPENQKKDSDIIEVKAMSFASREIRYTLQPQGKGAGTFSIGPSTGLVRLAKDLDYEDLRQPKLYSLLVTATEDSGGFSTFVELSIAVSDVNDNPPRFEVPDYQAHGVAEDVDLGTSILQVLATDLDQGKNADLVYTLDKEDFTIDNRGIIYSNKRLDADLIDTYVLTVRATDKGEPPLTGTATVRIYTENRNDEPPKFSQDVYTPSVDETAGPNTLVTTVVASDIDGDNVKFGFLGGGTVSGMFQIDPRTGVIRLINGPIHLDKDKYELNVTAEDDGTCCKNGGRIVHTSTALVVVLITDVNDNKPVFENCSTYSPKVQEGANGGTYVFSVKATDMDKGYNGQVRYSVVQQPNQRETKFIVDEITGEIRTNKVFDREGEDGRFVSVTLKATDRGNPPLEGVCSFKVEITDINDNAPLFHRTEYQENIKQDAPIDSNILRVAASDEDADNNGAVTYSLTSSSRLDLEYFEINPESGWIRLTRALDRGQYRLRAIATDKGVPPLKATVNVLIDVVDRKNNPPIWDKAIYGPIVIKENIQIGQKVISIKASSGIPGNPTVFYSLIKGGNEQTNKKDTFYLSQHSENGVTWADIFVNYALDYERVQAYNLTVRVKNNGAQQLASETTVNIQIEDVNDEVPLFIEQEQETVLEGMLTGTLVTQVQAVDKDGTYPNNKVYYSIEPRDDGDKFEINRETGEIFTLRVFDREERQSYVIIVKAEDGAPSARTSVKSGETNSVTKYIRIGIGDKNDNPPYFDQALYEAEVNEDEDIQHTVITVIARDKDETSRIRYEITQGNYGGAFAVKNETGAIYVASPLDYETRKEYNLTLVASDTLFENFTKVFIKVKDINDLPPKFDRPAYETIISEEDDRLLPKRILQVTAVDGDLDRHSQIVYFLTGQGIDDHDVANNKFSINSSTGEIYVLKPLDRDLPSGRSQWRFTVYADDEGGNGLVGYADVLVNLKDINDNAPFFPYPIYTGNVTENGTTGMTVMTMTATDYDDPLEGSNAKLKYIIEQNQVNENGEIMFAIDEESGVITTAVCCLDREKTPEYVIKVVAIDGGDLRGTGTATIKVRDINDMPPEFVKKDWYVQVEETEGDDIPEIPILVVSVSDGDLLETNRFNYKVIGNVFGADKFTMVTNSDGTGSLKIAKPLNYEDPQQRYGFNITIQVSDHGGETVNSYHVDYAKVFISLQDINDNPPEFKNSTISVDVQENIVNQSIAVFQARDPDQGGESRVSYSIERSSDKKRHFIINEGGVVLIRRPLDRETLSRHEVKILAIDDGYPARTATATLIVNVKDVNDNAPHFWTDYRPVVMENSPPQIVEEIRADDPDEPSEKRPFFKFSMDPLADKKIKQSFYLKSNPAGDDGKGTVIVYSNVSFDREEQKEYHIPILIADNGVPSLTSTNTLTVIIGDVNDNNLFPGEKDIFIYTFSGAIHSTVPIPIGRVHVNDLDDWDLPDKVFSWDNNENHPNFDLNEDSGAISIIEFVAGGKYTLNFKVLDRKWIKEVKAKVTVTVKEIPEEAVYTSGSIRISGISAEDFIRVWDWKEQKRITSKYERFKEVLSKLLKVKSSNIDIFTVLPKQELPPITDIRFSAHGSPYYKASKLNGMIEMERNMIEDNLGINITMVSIDECLYENINCEGSCTNELKVYGDHPPMVNANRTSFVGIRAVVESKCTCGARDFSELETCKKRPPPCFNDGSCSDKSGVLNCTCSEGFRGPRCQFNIRSFDGDGFAWFPSLSQCENSHFSLEFMTKKSNGLLLYNGPLIDPDDYELIVQDFVSLELQNGRPRLLIDFGSGSAEVIVNVQRTLNDGEWHKLDVFWDREVARLVVDDCLHARTNDSTGHNDRSLCESSGRIPLFNEFLNVNGPLQLGGVAHQRLNRYKWRYAHSREGFDGCIKNVMHNSEMYDMATPGNSKGSTAGCPPAENNCGANDITKLCYHGECVGTYNSAKCICDVGWHGDRCNEETKTKMFLEESYIQYALPMMPNEYQNEIQLSFRTRQKHGELFRATSKHGREYCILEIRNQTLRFRFNLNHLRPSERELWLPYIQVSDGLWHTVKVHRIGSTASMSLDGGEGRRYNEIVDYKGHHQLMSIEKQSIFVGGDVQYLQPDVVIVDNDFQEGCMNDIRLNQIHLPMERSSSSDAVIITWKGIRDGCPSNNPCFGIYCSPPFVCVDLWMLHKCTCPKGFTLTDDGRNCTDLDECLNAPCRNGGTCVNLKNGEGFYCVCSDGYTGDFCNAVKEEKVMQLSAAALALIVVCMFGILILVLVIVAYTRIRANQPYDQKDIIDDVRENIIVYDDEGGGEHDMNAYDIKTLRIPVDGNGTPIGSKPCPEKPPLIDPLHWQAHSGPQPDVGDFITDHLDKADNDPNVPPFDDLRNYAYEGGGSTAGSLSSLASGTDDNDQDFDYLNGWGPRFQKLADMYGQGESEED